MKAFEEKIMWYVPYGLIEYKPSLVQIMGWRQHFIWINDGIVYWRECASLGLNELMSGHITYCSTPKIHVRKKKCSFYHYFHSYWCKALSFEPVFLIYNFIKSRTIHSPSGDDITVKFCLLWYGPWSPKTRAGDLYELTKNCYVTKNNHNRIMCLYIEWDIGKQNGTKQYVSRKTSIDTLQIPTRVEELNLLRNPSVRSESFLPRVYTTEL